MTRIKATKPLWVGVHWTGDHTDITVFPILNEQVAYSMPFNIGHWQRLEVGDMLEFANTVPDVDTVQQMLEWYPDCFEATTDEPDETIEIYPPDKF